MSACAVHPSACLDYDFPKPSEFKFRYSENVPREVLLNETLKLRDEPKYTPPVCSNAPIAKSFPLNSARLALPDPMQELILTSKKLISEYKIELQYERKKNEDSKSAAAAAVAAAAASNATAKHQVKKSTTQQQQQQQQHHQQYPQPSASSSQVNSTPNRGLKRSRFSQVKDDAYENAAPASGPGNTPIPNKTLYFSPSGATSKSVSKKPSLIQLTAASSSMSIQKKPSLQRLLKTDFSSMHEFKIATPTAPSTAISAAGASVHTAGQNEGPLASTPVKSSMGAAALLEYTPEAESSYDQLACHADNILRMAVDSTMLGSSYNASILSNYSVGGPNDSMHALLSRRKNVGDSIHNKNFDIFDEHDAERSLLELRKSRRNMLSKEKATKIEINADDLNKVLGDM